MTKPTTTDVKPVPLVIGLLFVAIGLGVIADRRWGGVDVASVWASGAVIAGLALIGLLAHRRRLPEDSAPQGEQ